MIGDCLAIMPPGAGRERRAVLAASGRVLAAGAAGLLLGAAGGDVPSLAALAATRGFPFGATTDGGRLRARPKYATLLADQCKLLAPVLNWKAISPHPDAFVRDTDHGIVRFARAHGLTLTGAHLLWHEVVPKWFAYVPDAAAARRAIQTHIARMGAAYGSMTWSINVVNEALNPRSGRVDGLRRDIFARYLGSDYLNVAFEAARCAFPHSLLLLNDYGMEQEEAETQERRATLLRLLDTLQKTGTPIDGVGLQSHLVLGRALDAARYAAFVRQITSRGLRVVITELDVLDLRAPPAIAARDRAVADMYRRYLHVTLDNPDVAGVITWGLSDCDTWLTPATSRRFTRADGLPTRPLPFDCNLRPKPAYFAIQECFSHAPLRRVA